MRLKLITKVLTVLLATSSWQSLPAAVIAIDEQVQEFTQEERAALQLLIKLSAPAIAPFTHPIGHGFLDGGLISGPLLALLGTGGLAGAKKMLGPLGFLMKGGAIVAAVGTASALLVKTLGGSFKQSSKTLERTFKERDKAFKEIFDPRDKDAHANAKRAEKAAADLGRTLARLRGEIEGKLGKMEPARVDGETTEVFAGKAVDTLGVQDRQFERMLTSEGAKILREYRKIGEALDGHDQANDEACRANEEIKRKNDGRKKPKPVGSLKLKAIPYPYPTEVAHEKYERVLGQLRAHFNTCEEQR